MDANFGTEKVGTKHLIIAFQAMFMLCHVFGKGRGRLYVMSLGRGGAGYMSCLWEGEGLIICHLFGKGRGRLYVMSLGRGGKAI